MKTDIFPLNYFKSIWTPKKTFKGRHQLKGFQIILIMLFLNGLMMIPVSLTYANMDSYPIEGNFPNAFGLIDEKAVAELEKTEFSNGQASFDSSFYLEKEQGVIGGNLSEAEMQEAMESRNAILFSNDLFMIIEEGTASEVHYTKDFNLGAAGDTTAMKDALSQQWFIQNQGFLVSSLIFLVFCLILVSIIFIVSGSSLFMYLTKKSNYSSIKTIKESFNFIVNALGLPTVVAAIVGLLHFDVVVMLTIQSFGLIFMLLAVFYQTRFNDENI